MEPDLGTVAFGIEETRLGAMINDAEVLPYRFWRRRGQDLGVVGLDAELLPYIFWRLK